MADVFKVSGQNGDGKDLFVGFADSSELRITIDTDDVDTFTVAVLTRRMLKVLNDHWNDPEYSDMVVEAWPEFGDDEAGEDASEAYSEERYERGEKILRELMGK